MRTASIIIAVITLAACHRHTLPQSSTAVQKSDSVTVMYFYHDTVITDSPVMTAIHDTIPCPLLDLHSSVTSGNQQLTIQAHGGVLDVQCTSDSLQRVISVLSEKITELRQEKSDSTIVMTKLVDVPVTHIPTWAWWSLGINLVLLIVLYLSYSTGVGGWLSAILSIISKLFS